MQPPATTPSLSRFLTVPAVAKMLMVTHPTVYKIINQPNGLRAIRVGRNVRIPYDAFEAWLAGSAAKPGPYKPKGKK